MGLRKAPNKSVLTLLRMIVGLGNPGRQYQKTRHNAGFWFLDELVGVAGIEWRQESQFASEFASTKIQGESVFFVKPQNFMNRSGQSVGAVARYFKIAAEEILVVHDELDFEEGVVRLKCGGGHGGHNGLRDIVAGIGSKDFVRLRVGIGHPGESNKVADYVLSDPSKPGREKVQDAIARAIAEVDLLYQGDFEQFMTRLH